MLAEETYPGYAEEGDTVDRRNISDEIGLSGKDPPGLDPISASVTIA